MHITALPRPLTIRPHMLPPAVEAAQPGLLDLVEIGLKSSKPALLGAGLAGAVTGAALFGTATATALGAGLAGLGMGALATGLAWYIDRGGLRDPGQKADCAIVLGCAVSPDGKPSPSLEARVQHAEELYRQGRVQGILFTGGLGKAGFVESDSARQQALSHGVPAEVLATEGQSRTTWENFKFASPVMQARGWNTALICTDPYHENRSLAMANEFGLDCSPSPALGGPAALSREERRQFVHREVVSTYNYWGHRLQRILHLETPPT